MRYVNLIKHFSNWPAYFKYKFIGGAGPFTFVTRSGLTLEVPAGVMHDFKAVFFAECYVEAMPKPLRPNADIIDVGANIGSFTYFAVSQFPGSRVLAFEPHPFNFQYLARNAALNPGRAEIMRMAVADVTGKAMLVGGEADTTTTAASIVHTIAGGVQHQVETISLAELFEKYRVARCGLLKLDCEGAEFPILYGAPAATLERIDQIIMEVHESASDGPYSQMGLIDFLKKRGFHTRETPFGLLRAWR